VTRWRRLAPGLLKFTLVGGVIGEALGALGSVVLNLVRSGAVPIEIQYLAVFGGMFGASSGFAFGSLLTVLSGARDVDEIPMWRAGLLGVAAGAVFPIVLLGLFGTVGGGLPSVQSMLKGIGFFAGVGGIAGTSLIAVAKRAPAAELSSGDSGNPLPGKDPE